MLFESLLNKLSQGVLLVNKEQRIVVWNDWLEKVSGLKKTDVIGKKVANICPCFMELRFRRILTAAIADGQSSFCSGMLHQAFVFRRDIDNRKIKRQNMQIEPFEHNGEMYALIQINDITTQYRRVSCLQNLIKRLETDYQTVKQSEESTKKSALHDYLTGLCNRELLYERLKSAILESEKKAQLLAVLFIDLDKFKTINDTYGHAVGDALLKEVAVRIKRNVRSTDTVARLAGDEFIVVLSDIKTSNYANLVAHKIRQAISKTFNLENQVRITASIGICLYPADAADVENLLEKADSAMYSVKAEKRNDCKFYTSIKQVQA